MYNKYIKHEKRGISVTSDSGTLMAMSRGKSHVYCNESGLLPSSGAPGHGGSMLTEWYWHGEIIMNLSSHWRLGRGKALSWLHKRSCPTFLSFYFAFHSLSHLCPPHHILSHFCHNIFIFFSTYFSSISPMSTVVVLPFQTLIRLHWFSVTHSYNSRLLSLSSHF